MAPDTSTIATVDLSSPDPTPGLADAFATHGFAELTGHGLDTGALQRLRDVADRFFALPERTKRRFVHPDPLANRGFRARGSETLATSLGHRTPPDLFESFNAGTDRGPWTDLVQPTPWADEVVPGHREATLAVLHSFRSIGRRLDTLIGAHLGLDDLVGCSTTGPDMLACIDYRPGPDATETVEPGQQRMGAHSDYTTYTLLAADPVPGLQILGPDGDWLDVVPRAGSLIVNVGDLLAMWTDDHWPSTLHRVIPMAAGGAARRRSVAWFHYPDPDVVVAPRPGFVGADGPRYPAVRVEDHVRGKLAAPKTGELPSSVSTEGHRLDR